MARRPTSLRTRLAWLFLALTAAPILVSNVWGYLRTRQYVLEAAYRNLHNVVELEAAHTSRFLEARKRFVLEAARGDTVLRGFLRSWGEAVLAGHDVDLEELEAALRSRLASLLLEEPTARSLALYDGGGRLVAEARRPGAATQRDRSTSGCSTHATQPQVLALDPAPDGRLVTLGVLVPGEEGRPSVTFCATFLFEVHQELVTASQVRAAGASLYLLDQGGRVVCGSFPDTRAAPYDRPLAGRAAGWRASDRAGREQADGHDGHGSHAHEAGHESPLEAGLPPAVLAPGAGYWSGDYVRPDGRHVLAAFAPIPELGWGVLVEEPLEHALRDLEQLKRQALLAALALLAVMAGVILVTARSVAEPLRSLVEAAGRMARGQLGERVRVRGPEEVVALADAFNRMSEALQASQAALQQRVEERGRALVRSEAMSEMLLDAIEHRVMVLDRERRIVKANAAAGGAGGRLDGLPCLAVLGEGVEPCEGCAGLRTFRSGRREVLERPVGGPRGPEIVHIESYPIRGADGEVERVVELVRYVTDERRRQAQMVHQEKMAAFGLLAAGVAHEIGNPLAAMLSQVRLARSAPDPGRVDDTLDVLEKGLRRIEALLRDLVDFARRKRSGTGRVDARRVVDDVVRLVAYDRRARGVRIERKFPEGLPPVHASEDELTQVLFNLAVNGLDAMDGGGTLRFEVAVEGEEVVVRVADEGPGVPDEVRGRLFEPFFTTKERGTGLGLFVSRGIVERLGGRLELERTGPDGSVFAVRLPAIGASGTGART